MPNECPNTKQKCKLFRKFPHYSSSINYECRMNRFICPFQIIVILLLIVTSSLCQEMNTSTMGTRFITDIGEAFDGSVHVFSRPLYWQGDDWLNFGYVIAGAAALSLIDRDIRGFFLRNQSETGDALAKIGEFYGEPLTIVLITGSIYIFGNIADNAWARETAIIMTAALLPGGIYQTTAKISAGRARPYLDLGNYYFDPFRMEEAYYSFVSGHTLVAMTTSLVLAGRINNSIAKGFLYSLGVLTGLSRLYSDDHWLSDVVLGGALAAAVSRSAATWLDDSKEPANGGVTWQLVPASNGLSLTLTW
jgi:membrane-associated phospholipid phosphatase